MVNSRLKTNRGHLSKLGVLHELVNKGLILVLSAWFSRNNPQAVKFEIVLSWTINMPAFAYSAFGRYFVHDSTFSSTPIAWSLPCKSNAKKLVSGCWIVLLRAKSVRDCDGCKRLMECVPDVYSDIWFALLVYTGLIFKMRILHDLRFNILDRVAFAWSPQIFSFFAPCRRIGKSSQSRNSDRNLPHKHKHLRSHKPNG